MLTLHLAIMALGYCSTLQDEKTSDFNFITKGIPMARQTMEPVLVENSWNIAEKENYVAIPLRGWST